MRIIHSNQFSQKERTEYRKTIATNIATTLYTLLDNADWTCGLKSNAKDKSSKDDQLAYEVSYCYDKWKHNIIAAYVSTFFYVIMPFILGQRQIVSTSSYK